jgi:hypothetical protein
MSLRYSSTIDELLGDSLVQAIMRADNVEPQALKTLLADAAFRVAATPGERRPARGLMTRPPIDRRATSRDASVPARVRRQLLAGPCGSALCC